MLRSSPVNTSRAVPAIVAVVLMVMLTACDPMPMDIDFTVRKSGTISAPNSAGQRTMTLKGILACSGGTTSQNEPLDLFITAKQGTKNIGFAQDGSDRCQQTPKIWTETWSVTVPKGVDLAKPLTVTIQACTNPADTIDEDCTTVIEAVTLTSVG